MFNSSAKTEDKWDRERMSKTATYLLGKLNAGISKDAIEAAVTIQCANAMNEHNIDAKTLASDIDYWQKWLDENK